MIKFNDVNEALNSARMVMIQYLIGQIRRTYDNRISFSKNAYTMVATDENGDTKFHQPNSLFMETIDGKVSTTKAMCTFEDDLVCINDMSADDLYALCEMVYTIGGDCITDGDEYTINVEDIDFEYVNE